MSGDHNMYASGSGDGQRSGWRKRQAGTNMNIYTSETEYLKTQVQRLSALVRAQQITIDKLEAQLEQESVAWEISGKLTSLREVKGFVDTLVRDAEHNLRQLANTTPP